MFAYLSHTGFKTNANRKRYRKNDRENEEYGRGVNFQIKTSLFFDLKSTRLTLNKFTGTG